MGVRRVRGFLTWAATFSLSTGALGQEVGYQAIQVTDGGAVSGVVKFQDGIPTPAPIKTTKDTDFCGETLPDPETLQVNKANRGLRFAVVYLQGVTRGKKGPEKVVLDNQDCAFTPHTLAAMEGATLALGNKDPILHNTHIYLERRTVLNKALPLQNAVINDPRALRKAGELFVKCDAHEWMRGHILVLAHPYSVVTEETGSFSITEIPPGSYTLTVWHPQLGTLEKSVTIPAKGKVEASFTFTKK